jgi:hypothetical protein
MFSCHLKFVVFFVLQNIMHNLKANNKKQIESRVVLDLKWMAHESCIYYFKMLTNIKWSIIILIKYNLFTICTGNVSGYHE